MAFNELTDAQAERLAFLSEELGEAQQAIGKILRHGYESRNPLDENDRATNRTRLQRELGDVQCAIALLCMNSDLDVIAIDARSDEKVVTVRRWMHHQEEPNAE